MAVTHISAPTHDRDVSPVGAGRFDLPYDPPPTIVARTELPPQPQVLSSPPQTSSTNSPSSFTTANTSAMFTRGRSRHQPSDSVFSHADTVETAPTSASSTEHLPSEHRFKNETAELDNDEWFARFHSDLNLDSTQSDACPDRATLAAVQNIPIYDSDGTSFPFGSIYDPALAQHTRQLVLFVRHFYCGACQAFLQAMTASISQQDYFSIPIPTSIVVIGCGSPELIQHYKRFTGCPWPIYADPTRALFKKLGMNITLNIGFKRPEYMEDISAVSWGVGQIKQIKEELKSPEGIRKRDVVKGGNVMQIGGEFLFEEGQVVWCHRMKNYRGHTEIKQIRKLLELED
jgi:hypothetical protein